MLHVRYIQKFKTPAISLVLAGINFRDLVKSHYFDNTVKIIIYSLMTSYFNEILFDFVDQLDIENTKTSV